MAIGRQTIAVIPREGDPGSNRQGFPPFGSPSHLFARDSGPLARSADTACMEFQAVKPGQGVPRSRPWRGLVQATAILCFAVVATFGAFAWMMRDSLRTKTIQTALDDMNAIVDFGKAAIGGYAGEYPARFLSDSTHPIGAGAGPFPQALTSLPGDALGPATKKLPAVDPWQRSYLLELVRHRDTSKVQLRCLSAGPNGIVETEPTHTAPSGDDLLLIRSDDAKR